MPCPFILPTVAHSRRLPAAILLPLRPPSLWGPGFPLDGDGACEGGVGGWGTDVGFKQQIQCDVVQHSLNDAEPPPPSSPKVLSHPGIESRSVHRRSGAKDVVAHSRAEQIDAPSHLLTAIHSGRLPAAILLPLRPLSLWGPGFPLDGDGA